MDHTQFQNPHSKTKLVRPHFIEETRRVIVSMMESGLASRRRAEKREVVCAVCGTINPVIFQELGGTITIFCKACGEKIHLVFDRTILDMELKRSTQKEA